MCASDRYRDCDIGTYLDCDSFFLELFFTNRVTPFADTKSVLYPQTAIYTPLFSFSCQFRLNHQQLVV